MVPREGRQHLLHPGAIAMVSGYHHTGEIQASLLNEWNVFDNIFKVD